MTDVIDFSNGMDDGNQMAFETLISAPGPQVPVGAVPDVRPPQNASEAMLQPTTLAQLRGYQNGQLVRLPDFAEAPLC